MNPPASTDPTTTPPVPARADGVRMYRAVSPLAREYLGQAPQDRVESEAVEQLMRLGDREDVVFALLSAVGPGSGAGRPDDAAKTVGRVLSLLPTGTVLRVGSPLLALAAGADLDVSWRRSCPPMPGSLYAELQLLRLLAGHEPAHPVGEHQDPFAELDSARGGYPAHTPVDH